MTTFHRRISPNPDIAVERVTEWSREIEEGIFMAAGEPWEIDVAKKMIARSECHFFIAFDKTKKSANATLAKICEEAGFRYCKKIMAGRAGII